MSIISNIKKNLFSGTGYRLILFLQPILLTPLILNQFGEEVFSIWIIMNSLSIIFLSNDFGFEMANLMSWSNWIKNKKIIFEKFISVFFVKTIFYIVSLIILIFYIDYRFNDFKNLCIIILTYQFISHLSLTISRPLWTYGYNWKIHIINSIVLFSQLLIFFFIIFKDKGGLNSFILFPLIELLKILIFFYFINELFKNNINFGFSTINIRKTFFLKKEMVGFFLESISASIKVHLFRIITEIAFSVVTFINIVTSLTIINLNKSILNLISHVFLPELNRNKDNLKTYIKIMKIFLKVSFILNLLLFLFIFTFGEYIYKLWLQDITDFDKKIFYLLSLFIFFQNINECFIYVKISLNKHNDYFVRYTPVIFLNLTILFLHKSLLMYVFIQILIEILFFYFHLSFLSRQFKIQKKELFLNLLNLKDLKASINLLKTNN